MGKIQDFMKNFFSGLSNNHLGHSLKKWLAIGTFWLMCVVVIRYKTSENLFGTIGTLSTLIVTLMGINVLDKKTNGTPQKEDPNNPTI
jgi:hypothetical protein